MCQKENLSWRAQRRHNTSLDRRDSKQTYKEKPVLFISWVTMANPQIWEDTDFAQQIPDYISVKKNLSCFMVFKFSCVKTDSQTWNWSCVYMSNMWKETSFPKPISSIKKSLHHYSIHTRKLMEEDLQDLPEISQLHFEMGRSSFMPLTGKNPPYPSSFPSTILLMAVWQKSKGRLKLFPKSRLRSKSISINTLWL